MTARQSRLRINFRRGLRGAAQSAHFHDGQLQALDRIAVERLHSQRAAELDGNEDPVFLQTRFNAS